MAAKQEIHENGRVSALLQWVLGVSATITAAAIIGMAAIMLELKDSIANLNTQIALLNYSNQSRDNEHAEINRRIDTIERQRDR